MSHYIKIPTEQQYDFILRIVESLHVKFHDNVSAYVEYLDDIDALREAFEHPIDPQIMTGTILTSSEPEEPVQATPKRATRTRKAKAKDIAPLPVFCEAHPHFGAKRSPRTDCATCWEAYKKMNPMRYAAAYRKFIRSQQDSRD